MSKSAKKKGAPPKAAANKKQSPAPKDKKGDSSAIERAVYDGMHDLRVKKPR